MSPAETAIRTEIRRRGPIPFADFMALALGDPAGGYYRTAASRPTRSGDYLTAAELHPIFGWALARQVAEVWQRLERPVPFTIVEYGAGSGTLALAIQAGLREEHEPLAAALRYAPVEINDHRLAELRLRAAAAGLAMVDPASLDADPTAGFVLASEFLDALPVHVVEVRGGRPREVYVGVAGDGSFAETFGPISGPSVEERLAALGRAGIVLAEGQRLEVRPAVATWAAEVGQRLAAGVVMVLDYGAPTAELHGPGRRAGTLMTYRGHTADGAADAPYRDVGGRDITAHVDTTDLAEALGAAGLDLLGETSQAELLVGCGLEELLRREQARVATGAAALELRSAVRRLLDPRHLGGFRALLAGRGVSEAPPLRGLSYRLAARR
jgi:SAM-dependent MidA family methyltransferase